MTRTRRDSLRNVLNTVVIAAVAKFIRKGKTKLFMTDEVELWTREKAGTSQHSATVS